MDVVYDVVIFAHSNSR